MRLEEEVVSLRRSGNPRFLHRASTSSEDNDFSLYILNENAINNAKKMLQLEPLINEPVVKLPNEKEEKLPESPTGLQSYIRSFTRSDSNNSLLMSSNFGEEEILTFPKAIGWDWPFCHEGVARGAFMEDKFFICLPFNNGGTGETSGSTKKFERISDCNFSWTIGLSNSGEFGGNSFWRMELEVIRNLNMLAMIVSRDISTKDSSKKLKRTRKVYKLPDYYDVKTLTTKSYDWAILLEAKPRIRYRGGKRPLLRRSDTMT